MGTEHIALLSLAVTLLGTLIVSTWRLSSLASKGLAAVSRLEDKEREQDTKLVRLEAIPLLQQKVEFLERNMSIMAQLRAEVDVIKAEQKHSREMRRVLTRSRPEIESDGD